jgi:hypothetical protein
VSDEAPTLPLATESGDELPPNACPECAAEGLSEAFPSASALGSHRWNAHRVKGSHPSSKGGKEKRRATSTQKTTVNLNVGKRSGKGPENVAKTAQGATSFANMVAAGLALGGQAADASVVATHAETWGQAIGDLSQYQPWLVKVFAPSEAITGQGAAWAAVIIASAAIMVPVAVNHGWLAPETAGKLGVVAGAAAEQAQSATSPPDDGTSAAA